MFIQHNPQAKEYEIVADSESLKPKESTSNGNGAGVYLFILDSLLLLYLS